MAEILQGGWGVWEPASMYVSIWNTLQALLNAYVPLHHYSAHCMIGARQGKQADLAATQTRARERQFFAPGFRVSAFDPGELLHEADGDVGCFRQGELF